MEELIGLSVAIGATACGGPLTDGEASAAAAAGPVSSTAIRKARSAIRSGEDPLGDALTMLRPSVERRAIGAFYTNKTFVDSMVSWAIQQAPQRFVDPGCGSGRFALAALRRKPELEIVAVDLDPIATLLTRAALASVGARRVRVIQGDYLEIDIPSNDGRTAFVGNPPYVRHHDLHPRVKQRARTLALSAGYIVSGLTGLHALFYLATLAKHAKRGDVGAFITSAEWLDTGYGRIVRQMFANGLGGRSLLVFDADSVPFVDAMTTAAIATFAIGEQPSKVRFARSGSIADAIQLESEGSDVPITSLAESDRWSSYLRNGDVESAGSTIGNLFRVSRGQVTGANEFFVMSRTEARSRHIDGFCIPVISGADEVLSAKGTLRDELGRRVALSIPRDVDLIDYPDLADYIRGGEAGGVHKGYVASRRRPWFSIEFPRPPVVATYMARQAPVFALNPDGLGLLNVIHGLYPRVALKDSDLGAIVAKLNETRHSFVGRGRTYHGGLEKFEPREMEALPLDVPMYP